MTKQEIIPQLETLLKQENIAGVGDEVEKLEHAFQEADEAEKKEEFESFIAEGNDPDEFHSSKNPLDNRFKELLNNYYSLLRNYEKVQSEEEESNFEKKKAVIEELKELIEKEENIHTAFNRFNEIKEKWKSIGPVPIKKYKSLQVEYGHQIDLFYYTINIYKLLKELDLKKNVEVKHELIEKMEELKNETSIKRMEDFVKAYQEEWDEAGPVPKENWQEMRRRFRKATTDVYKKIQHHYDQLRQKQQESLGVKRELLEKAKRVNAKEIDSHKKWKSFTEQILKYQKDWKKAGYAPRESNEDLWKEFRHECDIFFDKKKAFYEELKKERDINKEKKQELLEKAEELKESTDWKETTEELISLQKKWTTLGSASQRDEQVLWKKFRAACDHFFNNKKKYFGSIDEIHEENLRKKQELIKELEGLKFTGDRKADLEALKSFSQQWNEIGHVPRKQIDEINQGYKSALDKKYDELNLSREERTVLSYKGKLERLKEKPNSENIIRGEERKIHDHIRSLEDTIQKYETNLQFFSAKPSSPIIKEVRQKIENTRQQLEEWRKKLEFLKQVK